MRFGELHPTVNLVWFAIVGAVTMLYMNPLTICAALISAIIMSGKLKKTRFSVLLVPMMLAAAIINPLFSHEGATVLAYFPTGNPLTLESIIYGISAALMVGASFMLCIVFGRILATDKLHYIIGRIFPTIALLISMTMRFVPRFSAHLREAYNARRSLIGGTEHKLEKIRTAASVTSGTVTWALENALDTADSMKCRGWGLRGRTSFTLYRFAERDRDALCAILTMASYFIAALAYGALEWRFYPSVKFSEPTVFGVTAIVVYIILCFFPIIMEVNYARNK